MNSDISLSPKERLLKFCGEKPLAPLLFERPFSLPVTGCLKLPEFRLDAKRRTQAVGHLRGLSKRKRTLPCGDYEAVHD